MPLLNVKFLKNLIKEIMLILKNINPKYSVFYIGWLVLKIIQEKKENDIMEIYYDLNNQIDISFSLYLFTLDWLYLANAIVLKDNNIYLNEH